MMSVNLPTIGNKEDEELFQNFTHLYEGLMKGDMTKVRRHYEKFPTPSPRKLTVLGDTLLHIAVYMNHENIARELLTKCLQKDLQSLCDKNVVGDTILHEVAAANMVSLARDLLDTAPQLLSEKNNLGETPLFCAAHNGHREMFDLLAFAVHLNDKNNLQGHLTRKDGNNILHMTILAEYFDLAFEIAKKYPDLVFEEDGGGNIGLQLLSSNPSAFMSGRNYGWLRRFIYKHCIPTSENVRKKEGYQEEEVEEYYELDDKDSYNPKPERIRWFKYTSVCMSIIASALRNINISIWKFLRGGWPMMERMYNDYSKHESAMRLAKLLIKKDLTWELILYSEETGNISVEAFHPKVEASHPKDDEAATSTTESSLPNPNKEQPQSSSPSDGIQKENTKTENTKTKPRPSTALLTATSTGIVEIVKEILRVYPQAVEHVNDTGQNIMHIAIKHRQLEIFRLVNTLDLPMSRLVRRIDDNGYTLLHHVGVMTFYTGGNLPGPALQLQQELHWFERVKKIIPPQYEMHSSKKGQTAPVFFREQHSNLLKEAQDWLKRTSESCSAVAVLIATVAFAAAYTVPGGSNQDTGVPILLQDPFFLVFTVMDVLSLASSLTSVVMFLSILTSPFQLEDFHYSLPRKLTLGFTFLFFAVAVTMLAFAATIVLIIHLKKRWITTFIYSLAFLPVAVFALLQFPLYLAFMDTMKYSWKLIRNYLPWRPVVSSICKIK